MIADFGKGGQGAFRVIIEDNLETRVSGENVITRNFVSPREAYDYYRPMTQGNNTFWSICYHLEDYLEEKAR